MNPAIHLERLTPGFIDQALESQQVFRKLLSAMSYPGRIVKLSGTLKPPDLINMASGAICLTLLDYETPLWSNLNSDADAISWIRFHTGCPIVAEPSLASFALITSGDDFPPLSRFKKGTAQSPESSATLILQVDGFTPGRLLELSGPGIKTCKRVHLKGLSEYILDGRSGFNRFPLGLDMVLTHQNHLLAIPRSVHIASAD